LFLADVGLGGGLAPGSAVRLRRDVVERRFEDRVVGDQIGDLVAGVGDRQAPRLAAALRLGGAT